jgi:hypothetical protein
VILIAFRHSDTRPFARLVTALRGGDSAHVESAVPVLGVHLCVSASWMDGGARGKVIDIAEPAEWRVYRWTGDHLDPIEWLKKNRGAKYDRRGLLGILVPPVGHNRTKRFCSEVIAELLMLPDPYSYDLAALERFLRNSWAAERVEMQAGQWVALPKTIAA